MAGWLWVECVPYLNLFILVVPMRKMESASASDLSGPNVQLDLWDSGFYGSMLEARLLIPLR